MEGGKTIPGRLTRYTCPTSSTSVEPPADAHAPQQLKDVDAFQSMAEHEFIQGQGVCLLLRGPWLTSTGPPHRPGDQEQLLQELAGAQAQTSAILHKVPLQLGGTERRLVSGHGRGVGSVHGVH